MSERRPERPPFETPETVLELQPAPEAAPDHPVRPGRMHLVVVVTRAVTSADSPPPSAALIARFIFRRGSGCYGVNGADAATFDAPHAYELVFEARREDFSRPSTEAMLEDVGLTPQDVADLMERVDRENGGGEPS